MEYKVYLAGPITGLNYEGTMSWREYAIDKFKQMADTQKRIIGVSPMRAKEYLSHLENIGNANGALGKLSGGKAVVTRDRNDVYTCDAVLMNLQDAKRVSIGTMIEVGWADAFKKPIVLMLEPGNIHQHDMVTEISGFRADNLDEAIHLINAILP